MASPRTHPEGSEGDLSGSTIGRFEIHELLGAGGMGEVYRANDTMLRRPVALKRVAPKLRDDPRQRERILKEAQRASALNSEHIAGVYDVLERQGELFLVMEYVEGTTLRRRLSRGALSLQEFPPIAVQCAEALSVAHQKGIIHRDIKPENIMLTSSAGVKILDFGLARRLPLVDESAATASLQSQDDWAGTPAYMSPEALLQQKVDGRSDLFSLGIVFYEMLAGASPFRAEKPILTSEGILHRPARPLHEVAPAVSPELERIISKLLAKDPAQRYATAADLIVDLRALQRGEVGSPPLPRRRLLHWAGSTAKVLGTVVAFLALLSLLPFARHEWQHWTGRAELPARKNLAVLPFLPVSQDANARAFSQGLTETLTAKLAQLSDRYPLQVVPTSEVQKMNSVEQARTGVGANLVVEGSLQQAGSTVRVAYNIVDAGTRRALRAGTITAEASNPFAVEDRVVESVLNALELQLAASDRRQLEGHGTTTPEAFDYYLRGRGYLLEYHSLENLDSAISVFQRAIAADPKYALAYAGLGEAYWQKYEFSHAEEWASKATEACRRSAALGDGHNCLGVIYNGTGKYEEAATEFEQTLQADPTSDDAYRGLAFAWRRLGKAAEAERTYQRAISVRPQYWAGYNALGSLYFSQARYADAAKMFAQVVALAPDSFRGYYNLGGAYIALGRYRDAVEAMRKSVAIRPSPEGYTNLGTAYFYQRKFSDAAQVYQTAVELAPKSLESWGNLGEALYWVNGARDKSMIAYQKAITLAEEQERVNPRDSDLLGELSLYYAMAGKSAEARKTIARALALAPKDAEVRYEAAIVALQGGNRAGAVEWLEKAVAAGFSPTRIVNNPLFDSLAGNPRVQTFLHSSQSAH
jgi:tetratricopeptide (TPR) repeat protein/predicted Ser/Thr protein kinase